MNRWLLGYPDQALADIRDARVLSEQLGHPLTTVHTLWFTAWIQYQRGEREAAAETAERLASLADSHGFKGWLDARIIMSDTRASVHLDAVALAKTHQQLLPIRRSAWSHVSSLCMFAELCLDSGHPEEGLRALAKVGATDRNAFCAPEVYRIEGELLLRSADAPTGAAEQRLRTALDLARRRAEKSLELRAAMSLARLWGGQGRNEEAWRLLVDIYGWFTEGLQTRDLVAAKALLEER
jgi:hypothetical protein